MTPERWRQVEGLFLQAIECPADEREGFLAEVCAGDESLREEVRSLLACDDPTTSLISSPFLPLLSVADDPQEGRRIGPYRLIRLLGRGGMGSVYLAERDDQQYRKQVAIKLLRRGMDTDLMLSRFRQERQILASLEHSYIARLLDGGATDDGLPYFVLEYVAGVSLTTYCSEKHLAVRDRLLLFRRVCEAVQYAHQNLVVHRDLKPGNILVTEDGVPKLLDFGIAKLIHQNHSFEATLTHSGFRLMTPAYASPEQAMGRPITTASDIYALGTLLYEVLTGEQAQRFASESPSEIERMICQAEPEKPSIVASGRRLRQQLSGDLDDIILTAMTKDPNRRYTSVAELSDDIRRHLENLPIRGGQDKIPYRAGKFIRRYKAGLLVAFLLGHSGKLVG